MTQRITAASHHWGRFFCNSSSTTPYLFFMILIVILHHNGRVSSTIIPLFKKLVFLSSPRWGRSLKALELSSRIANSIRSVMSHFFQSDRWLLQEAAVYSCKRSIIHPLILEEKEVCFNATYYRMVPSALLEVTILLGPFPS